VVALTTASTASAPPSAASVAFAQAEETFARAIRIQDAFTKAAFIHLVWDKHNAGAIAMMDYCRSFLDSRWCARVLKQIADTSPETSMDG
jgi:hypothetical protein